ncbi:MAG: hypothetical protein M1598_07200, partial [Actinobacteria bacterium]|nr:hypothetical protein [Actinomycetota bacterium]
MLRVSDGAGQYVYQDNAFCLSCHGPKDRNLNGSPPLPSPYYNNTAGDHTNANAAHYDATKAALQPASGTQITCVQCHDKHAAPNSRLLKQTEQNLCFSCHNNTANSMGGRNIQAEFNQGGSSHDITGATGAKVECSSCHGPHTVARADIASGGTTSQLSNPANTKQDFAQVASSPQAYARITQFCVSCHSGSAPPAATTSTSIVVPFTVQFQNRTVTTNAGGGGANTAQRGWDKSTYTSSIHYQNGVGCQDCHNSHGSQYPTLLSRLEDTSTSGTGGVCGRCHSGSPPAQFSTAKNVWPDLTRTGSPSPDRYRHPTLYVSGKHSDTEDYSTVNQTTGGNIRHAECLDCHDPHNERPFTPTTPPAAPGPLQNMSGVSVNFGTVTWSGWNPTGGTPSMTPVNPIQNQYELCFKCHSSYSWGSNPPVPGGSIAETDTPKEFNPNNPAYHAVVGASKLAGRTFTYNSQTYTYGKFTAPTTDPATKDSAGNAWTASSRLYCEDCHRSGADDLRGPHGSNYWYILRAPWTRATGAEGIGGTGGVNTGDHLCFKCHDYNFYATGLDAGSATVRSGFSNSSNYNLHKKHKERGCTSCHTTVPHGWKIKALLANKSSASDPNIPGSGGDPTAPAPYYDSSYL